MTIVIIGRMTRVIYLCKGLSRGTIMRVSQEKAAQSRDKIMTAAARLFRERVFDGVGVDAVSQAAGLTHGGFYRHFQSKEDLAAQALAHLAAKASSGPYGNAAALAAYVDRYLSPRHRDDAGHGCMLAALAADVSRSGARVRRPFTAALAEQFARFAAWFGGSEPEGRSHAIAAVSTLVGALVLARAVDDPDLSIEILDAAKTHLGAMLPEGSAGERG